MPAQRRWLLIPALLLLIGLTALMGHRLAIQSSSSLSLLPDDYRSGGGAGLFLWARRLSIPTGTLEGPLWEADRELGGPGHCVITAGDDSWDPYAQSDAESLTAEQWNSVQKWIEAGNILIVVTSDSSALPAVVRDRFTGAPIDGRQPALTGGGSSSLTAEESVEEAPTVWGGRLAVSATGPRLTGVPADWVIAGSPESAVLVRQRLGRGGLYLLLDRDAWTNARLDRADNAATLYRIIHGLDEEPVLAIDQYRHGRGRVESFATYLLRLPGGSAFAWMLLLVGALWIWSRNQRLGPAETYYDVERRTAREYVEAVAAMNQRARAAPLAVKAVSERVMSLLRQRGAGDARSRELEDQAKQVMIRKERPRSPTTETALVSELITLRNRIYGSGEDSGSGVADEGGAAQGVLRTSGRG